MIVNRLELAEALNISPSKVSALANQGIFPAVSRGKYDLSICVQQFIEISVEHLLKKKSTGHSVKNEDLQYWKMQRAKHAALKEMGILIKTDDAEKIMSSRLSQIRNILIAIDSVWAPYMVGLKTVEDSQKMLSKQLDNLFEQLSSLQDFEIEEEMPSNKDIEHEDEIDELDEVTETPIEDII